MDLPAPIETACEARDQKSTFFHLLFSVTPKTPGNATADWKKLAEESLASYVRDHCAEGVLVQALHTDTLRLEVAIRFSGPGRDRNFVRDNLRRRTVLQSLPGSTQDWKVDSKIRGQAEDARLAVYESLRGRTRTVPPSRGGGAWSWTERRGGSGTLGRLLSSRPAALRPGRLAASKSVEAVGPFRRAGGRGRLPVTRRHSSRSRLR